MAGLFSDYRLSGTGAGGKSRAGTTTLLIASYYEIFDSPGRNPGY